MNKRRYIGPALGLAALGVLAAGYLFFNKEVKRDVPLQIISRESIQDIDGTRREPKTLAYMIDFHGTKPQILFQNPDVYNKALFSNPTWDVVAFYSLPEKFERGFDVSIDAIRRGKYPVLQVYVRPDLERRMDNDSVLKGKLKGYLGESYNSGYKIMTEEQSKFNASDVFDFFDHEAN